MDMGSKLLISGSADCTLRVIDITAKKYLFPIHTGEKSTHKPIFFRLWSNLSAIKRGKTVNSSRYWVIFDD